MVHHAPGKRKEKPVLHSYCGAFRVFVNQLRLPWHPNQRSNLVFRSGAFLMRRSLPVRRLAHRNAKSGKREINEEF